MAKVGQKNSVVEVANGYAQFLIGQGKAEVATIAKVTQAEKRVKEHTQNAEALVSALESGMKKLKNDGLTIHATANEKNHLFEAVSVETIASHIKDIIGAEVEVERIVINKPIKELGEHLVGIKVGSEVVELKVKVEGN